MINSSPLKALPQNKLGSVMLNDVETPIMLGMDSSTGTVKTVVVYEVEGPDNGVSELKILPPGKYETFGTGAKSGINSYGPLLVGLGYQLEPRGGTTQRKGGTKITVYAETSIAFRLEEAATKEETTIDNIVSRAISAYLDSLLPT